MDGMELKPKKRLGGGWVGMTSTKGGVSQFSLGDNNRRSSVLGSTQQGRQAERVAPLGTAANTGGVDMLPVKHSLV